MVWRRCQLIAIALALGSHALPVAAQDKRNPGPKTYEYSLDSMRFRVPSGYMRHQPTPPISVIIFTSPPGSLVTLRSVARSSLVASDFTFLPVTTIESVGMISVVVVANTYFLDSSAGFSGPQLRTGGGPVVAGPGPWMPLGAEQVGSGYQVVWKNGSADQYSVWTTDGSGNFLSSSSLVSSSAPMSGASVTLQAYEVLFQQDFNGNQGIGSSEPILSFVWIE